jgi:hypothetical protein
MAWLGGAGHRRERLYRIRRRPDHAVAVHSTRRRDRNLVDAYFQIHSDQWDAVLAPAAERILSPFDEVRRRRS